MQSKFFTDHASISTAIHDPVPSFRVMNKNLSIIKEQDFQWKGYLTLIRLSKHRKLHLY